MSLKHLLICGLVRCAESMLMTCLVFEMEFEMALYVSPVSQPRVPNVVSGGMAPSKRFRHMPQRGKDQGRCLQVFDIEVGEGVIYAFLCTWNTKIQLRIPKQLAASQLCRRRCGS